MTDVLALPRHSGSGYSGRSDSGLFCYAAVVRNGGYRDTVLCTPVTLLFIATSVQGLVPRFFSRVSLRVVLSNRCEFPIDTLCT